MNRTLSVGVTGGIGSGKSEVCRHFASFGAQIIEADALARELMEEDAKLAHAIRQEFGNVYTPSGRLDARGLAAAVFRDPQKLTLLNSLVHPVVIRKIGHELERARASAALPVIAVEAALIFEAEMEELFDYTVAVLASRELQIERVMRRDRAKREDVVRRMGAQLPEEEKAERADFVIRNTGDKESLRKNSAFVWSLLGHLSGS